MRERTREERDDRERERARAVFVQKCMMGKREIKGSVHLDLCIGGSPCTDSHSQELRQERDQGTYNGHTAMQNSAGNRMSYSVNKLQKLRVLKHRFSLREI